MTVAGARLECIHFGPQPADAPCIVMLHEGLGCVGLWGEFPAMLQRETGFGVFVYSRAGYGASDPVPLPRPLTYMHDEARNVLPLLLDAIGFRECILFGHSDGASIAAIHAGDVNDARVRGVCLMAPHFFVEDISIASIAEAKIAYEMTDLRPKLSRWHKNVDCAFRGWSDAWLDPDFRKWNILDSLAKARASVLIVQGREDQYGTLAQIERARDVCAAPFETVILDGVRHSPHREAPQQTLEAVARFARQCLDNERASKERAT